MKCFICWAVVAILVVLILLHVLRPKARMHGKRIDSSAYLIDKKVAVIDKPKRMEFRLLQASFPFTDEATLLFFVNGHLAYRGSWKKAGEMQFFQPADGGIVHCKLEVVDQGRLYIFDHKSVFLWRPCFRFLYVVFPPDEAELDSVLFFPQEHKVIQ